MGETAKKWWNLVVTVESVWAIIEFVRTSILGPIKIVGCMQFHPSFFLLLAMLGAAGLIGLNFSWTSPTFKTKRTRFGELYKGIVELRGSYGAQLSFNNNSGVYRKPGEEVYAETVEISDTLRRLGIEYPDISQDDGGFVSMWFYFLCRLAPLAQHKDIAKARRASTST